MTFIAILNAAKHYFAKKHAERALRHLDTHSLRDIGFYQDNGHIRPLSGSTHLTGKQHIHPSKPIKQPSDG